MSLDFKLEDIVSDDKTENVGRSYESTSKSKQIMPELPLQQNINLRSSNKIVQFEQPSNQQLQQETHTVKTMKASLLATRPYYFDI